MSSIQKGALELRRAIRDLVLDACCFSQGVKVCFEIVLMVTDAVLLTSGEKVFAIAGTGRGSDTALVMQAASSQNIKKLWVNEVICKPLNPLNIDELREKITR